MDNEEQCSLGRLCVSGSKNSLQGAHFQPHPNRPLERFSYAPSGHLEKTEGGLVGVGVSLLLIAVGAILIWAVEATVAGIDIVTVGWILLIVGAIGFLLSLVFWSTWGGPGYFGARRRTMVDEGPPPAY
jgi:hypothetical protein